MASKNNQQSNNTGNNINRTGTTISNQGMKALQSNPMFQRRQVENDAPSSSLQSNNKKTQSKSSKASSKRSNNSNKKSKLSSDKTNSANRISRGEATLSNEIMKELQSSPKFQRKQSEHSAPSSDLRSQSNYKTKSSMETDKSNSMNNDESSNRAHKKRSKIKKALDKFTNIIKSPTKTIKSSLRMNNR